MVTMLMNTGNLESRDMCLLNNNEVIHNPSNMHIILIVLVLVDVV